MYTSEITINRNHYSRLSSRDA